MNKSSSLIQEYYSAFNSKDVSKMLSLLSDNVIHDISQGQREVGKEAFAKFLETMNFHYDEFLDQITIMTSIDGSRAAAEFICNGTYLRTANGLPEAKNQTYKIPVGCFFDISNGLIQRVSNHYNLNDWIKQVK